LFGFLALDLVEVKVKLFGLAQLIIDHFLVVRLMLMEIK
jgi:hypothetical protein